MPTTNSSDNPFRLRTLCPHCTKALKIRESLIGQIIRCPSCRKKFEPKTLSSADADQSLMSIVATLGADGDATLPGSQATLSDKAKEGVALGRFQLQKVLGEGAFGKVYKAYDPQLDRLLAIKTPKFNTNDRQQVERFLSEARSAAQLRHQNIVPTHESGKIESQYFIAAQFIDGNPLSAVIKQGGYDRREAVAWVASLAEAVAYAHARGIVHRDIKPHNVMLDENNEPQLMDFGLAGRAEDESTRLKAGVAVGTPAYMPPEQASGEVSAIGPWSDQYSIGVVLYEMLTGNRPYTGDPQAVVAKVLSEDPPRPRSWDRSIPRDLEAICMKAMAREPSERYPSCLEFADDLSRWLKGESTRARPLFVSRQLWRWGKKNPFVFAAGVVCAAAVISAAFVAFAYALNRDHKLENELKARLAAVRQKEVAEKAVEVANANIRVAKQAMTRVDKEKQAAADALRVAEKQKALAEESRGRASKLLLENSLKEIVLHKEPLRLPETSTSVKSAIAVAEQVGETATLRGLRLDLKFLEALTPTISKLDRVDGGVVYPISKRVGILSADGFTGRLCNLETRAAFGESFRIPTSESRDERLIHAWLTEDSFQWATMVADPSGNYWKHARIHKVLLQSAQRSAQDGADSQPFALDSADKAPFWVSADGSTIAWRPRDDTQVIAVHTTADMQELCRIESPEFEFHSAALSVTGDFLAIAATGDSDQLRVFLYETDSANRKKTLARRANAAFFQQSAGIVAIAEGGVTKVIDLADGVSLGEFPGTQPGLLAVDQHRNRVARYLPGRLAVQSQNAVSSRNVTVSGEAIGLEVDTEGRCGIFTSQRLHLVDSGRNHGSVQFAEPIDSPFRLAPMLGRVAWPETTAAPTVGLELVSMSENNSAFLVSSETAKQLAQVGNDFIRYQVRRSKDLAMFHFGDGSKQAVRLPGSNGSVTLQSLSTKIAPEVLKAEKPEQISQVRFERLLNSDDSITLSETGRLAVVRDLGETQRLMLCATGDGRFFGDFHLTHPNLTDRDEVATEANTTLGSGRSGPARFDRSEKMFVYRIDDEQLGIVSTATGERTGPTLKLMTQSSLLEIGWTLDSSKLWCLTGNNSDELTLRLLDVVTGEANVMDLPSIGALKHIEYSRFGEQLFLHSTNQYICIDVLGNQVTKQGRVEPGDQILACSLRHDKLEILTWNANAKRGGCELVPLSDSETTSYDSAPGAVCVPSDSQGKVGLKSLLIPNRGESIQALEFWSPVRPDSPVASLNCIEGLSEIVFAADGQFAVMTTRTGKSSLWHLPSSTELGPNLRDLVAWPADTGSGDRKSFVFSPDSRSLLALDNRVVIAAFTLPSLDLQ